MKPVEPDKDQLRDTRRVVLDVCRSPISPMDLKQVLYIAGFKEELAGRAVAAELGRRRLTFTHPEHNLQTVASRRRRSIPA